VTIADPFHDLPEIKPGLDLVKAFVFPQEPSEGLFSSVVHKQHQLLFVPHHMKQFNDMVVV
jgi:hypothetical protein